MNGSENRLIVLAGLCAVALARAPREARAGIAYTLQPTGGVASAFNTSAGTETENDFVANSYTVTAGATRLTSVVFPKNSGVPAGQTASVAIYTGSSLTDPHAGGGLVRVETTTTTLTPPTGPAPYTITLDQPVDLPVGQVFYVGLLLPQVPAADAPFSVDPFSAKLSRSFFDVGPTMGAPYNLDDTANLTVLGGIHPVVGNATPAGNLYLSVNAVPEPATAGLVALGGLGLLSRRRT